MNDPADPAEAESAPALEREAAAAPTPACSQCGAERPPEAGYCSDCGLIFPDEAGPPAPPAVPDAVIGGRYRLTARIGERGGVTRFRGEDIGNPDDPMPVVVVRQAVPDPPPPPPADEPELEVLPGFDFELPDRTEHATVYMPVPAETTDWPSTAWEQGVLLRAAHLSLPRLIDSFTEDGVSYLIEETPRGTPLWDAWDREGVTNQERFTWLMQLAQAIDRLHTAGVILEGLRPEMVVVSSGGFAILTDLSDLLPLPLPVDVPLRGGFSTAPELLLSPATVDERADLYAFGALLYALLLGRELSDLDFTLTGMPKSYLERVPDANPFLARVMAKTFVRDPAERFPTDDGSDEDRTGFRELVAALDACRRNLDRVRLDIACWSTTGIVRSGNEDAVYVFHSAEGRLDDSDETALILLADGMGGMESGEVAAALTLQTLRECLLAGQASGPALPLTPAPDGPPPEPLGSEFPTLDTGGLPPPAPPELFALPDKDAPARSMIAYVERVTAALEEANRRVFELSRSALGARGMGCTAEVVVIDGGQAVIGHVGDSRVYHLHRGKLTQVTRDHTIVARLIEQGLLTEKDAETHPRRSELQQAIGGRPDVYPDVLPVTLEPGDWLVVCSDGLSNQLPADALRTVLQEARSAERAARVLVNSALFDGAMDNVTVAVVRCS